MLFKFPPKSAAGFVQQQYHSFLGRHKIAYLQYSFKSTENLHWGKDLTNGFLQEDTRRKNMAGSEAMSQHILKCQACGFACTDLQETIILKRWEQSSDYLFSFNTQTTFWL